MDSQTVSLQELKDALELGVKKRRGTLLASEVFSASAGEPSILYLNEIPGLVFLLWTEDGIYFQVDFDCLAFVTFSDATRLAEIIVDMARPRKREDLIQDLRVDARLVHYSQGTDGGGYPSTRRKYCQGRWLEKLCEVFEDLEDVIEAAKAEAEIQKAVDALSMLSWWFQDKEWRLEGALKDPGYIKKMDEITKYYDEVREFYLSESWKSDE